MALPNVTDLVRINPPYASIVVGRTPLVQWHATKSGARRAALSYNNTRSGDPEQGESRYSRFSTKDAGVAVVSPSGDLEVIESWAPGDKIEWVR